MSTPSPSPSSSRSVPEQKRTKAAAVGTTATLLGGAGSALLLALTASPAGAATTWTVDTLADGAPSAADCAPPTSGSCSLRDALAAASPGDSIAFLPSLFAGGPASIMLTSGVLTDLGVDIVGPGSSLLTVHGDGTNGVFEVSPVASGTTLSGLTITGGQAVMGGGVAEITYNPLTLRDTVVTGNTAANGAGVYAAELTLIDSEVSGNRASYLGGGLMTVGKVTISNSTIAGNSTSLPKSVGGGLVAIASAPGTEVSILDSTFSGNTAVESAGGIFAYGEGGTLTIANSTITGNSARQGGGLQVAPGNTVKVEMSTITGNTATGTNEFYSGGGIRLAGSALAPTSVPSSLLPARRGPVVPSSLAMTGVILAGNTAGTGGSADLAVGDGPSAPANVTMQFSMFGTASSNVTVAGTGVIRGSDPKLGALAANGGRTKTMLPLTGSPVIDAGPATIPDFPGNSFDQRGPGFARVSGDMSDIGAVEIQVRPPEPVVPTFAG